MLRITGKIDKVNVMREQSRDIFKAMPKQSRIPDKRRKPPRYKTDWRRDV